MTRTMIDFRGQLLARVRDRFLHGGGAEQFAEDVARLVCDDRIGPQFRQATSDMIVAMLNLGAEPDEVTAIVRKMAASTYGAPPLAE